MPPPHRWPWRPASWLLATLLAAGAACSDDRTARARGEPNVILIVLDTLRADRLSQYGYGLPTSEALDALAARSTRFEECLAPAPWTTPSTASILTGLHPVRHGSTRSGAALGDEVVSLAETLQDQGWQTFGISFNHNVSRASLFDAGFDRFEDFTGKSTAYTDASELVSRALSMLDEEVEGRFFLYLQPMNTHGPYLVPEQHQGDLLGRPPSPAFKYYGPTMKAILKQGELDARARVGEQTVASAGEQYDTAVRYTARCIGELLDGLRARGLYDGSLIIVTADHGEELFEHGGFSHGYSLHKEVLHVPLLVKLPYQREARSVRQRVSLMDVHPTVLDVLGLQPALDIDGSSLLPLARDPSLQLERPFVFHVDWDKRCVAQAILSGRHKLIRIVRNYEGLAGELRLFDVHADPHETTDVAAHHPELVARLLEQLEADLLDRASRALSLPPDVRDRMDTDVLRELGYL